MSEISMPKTYDFASTEQRLYAWWWRCGWFKPEAARDAKAEPYVISIPPPNVTRSEDSRHRRNRDPQNDQAVRSNEGVIMLSGHGDIRSVEEGMKSGAFEYIMKPIGIDVLIVKINAAKGKRDQIRTK